jgi:hypothetical protein
METVPDGTDYSEFVDKAYGDTMEEFIEWAHENVPYPKLDDRSLFLGARLYGYFQRSESHQARIAAKSRGEATTAKVSKRGRPAPAKAAPAKPAAKAAAKPAAPKAAAKPAARKPAAKPVARPGKRGSGAAPY